MRSFRIAARKLFRKGEHTTTRIISLATGLAFGLLLFAEVFYYYSYDSFYPDANRLYVVNTVARLDKSSEELSTFPQVSGAIAPGLKAEVPGIEAATRLTSIGELDFFSEEELTYNGEFVLADEYLHDLMPRPILAGNKASEILKTPMNCMVSSEIADKMGGNVVGKMIELKDYPGKKLTIGGVFEKLPENSNYKYDVAISMPSIGNFIWDGSENWLGNDRYYSVVKIAREVTPESLAPAVREMQKKHQNIEELERKHEIVLKYSFESLPKYFSNQMKEMIFVLSAIAFIVLFVSVMNYMLLTVSTLVNRAKTSAVCKCYGAEKRDLHGMIFAESTLIFLVSLVVAFGLMLLVKPFIEAQVAHSLKSTLNVHVIIPILLILGVLILFVSYIPGRVFAQTPVAEAFRSYRKKSTQWKKVLLAVQFTGAALIMAMLLVVSMQYDKMKNAYHGYDTENIYYTSVSGMDPHKLLTVLNQLEALPEVEMAGFGEDVPISGASGNNVLSPDREKDLFNVADFYYVDDSYFSILNIPVVSGQAFQKDETAPNSVMISQKGADLLVLNNGWTDGVAGKSIEITEHNVNGASTISGVFSDLIIGSISNTDTRPSVFFYRPRERFAGVFENNPASNFLILIRTRTGSNLNVMQKFTDIINNAIPRGEARVYSLAAEQEGEYQAERGFRNALYVGGFVILLITVIGLLGYLSDEIIRYRKNLAIRRINGATVIDVIRIFVSDISRVAVPCVVLGLTGAWFLAMKWLQNFSVQISLQWWVFILAGIAILLLTGAVAVFNSTRAAMQNPVNSLRYE
ncbi:MAG TPA: ABC transporter permease [Bacteroidales bacterium]|nr:ABC transporter permease [Bacteroidales bacterium]